MRKGVLLLSRSREVHADAVARELSRRGRPVTRLNPATYPLRSTITLRIGPDESPTASWDASLASFGVGWCGASLVTRLDGSIASGARRFAKAAARQGLDSLVRAAPFSWVNDPHVATWSDDKFRQLVLAKELGFAIPRTVFTNDPTAFARFRSQGFSLIAKSASGSNGLPASKRVLTTKVRATDALRSEDVRLAPVLFQEEVPKDSELRVTVIGDDVFPVRIHSQASPRTRTDWRRYGPALRYSVARLPRSVTDRCRKMARASGLAYGGIDLIERPDGEHVFLEINSLPAWLWLEKETGLKMTAALADLLESRIGRRVAS